MHASTILPLLAALALGACGGSSAPAHTGGTPSAQETAQATRPCGETDAVHKHDLGGSQATEALAPCAKSGSGDYSGAIKIETIPEGIHITINATDDMVNNGILGTDVKTRDAVIVYPKGRNSKESVEVPLIKTKDGYTGDKIVLYDQLDKLTDDGTKIDVAIFDHDGKTGETSEEMHVSVAVSTGKSCEKAVDENPQTIDFGKKGKADLTDDQLGGPMKSSGFFSSCGLANSANADICVAVKQGKPLGVSVNVTPRNNRVAACIDRSTRHLHFPESDKLDVVHQHF
jgi:hypothetical protein